MYKKLLLAAALVALVSPATASNSAWINKTVRVGYAGALVTGKIIHSQGCLYVKFDRPAPGGITMVRVADLIESLQARSANNWVPQNLQAIRKIEPAACFAAANG
jgi:hypothetical protein